MVCQLDTNKTTTESNNINSKIKSSSTNNILLNTERRDILSSSSLTLLTKNTTSTINQRRTSSIIIQNEKCLIKNAISLDNLEQHQSIQSPTSSSSSTSTSSSNNNNNQDAIVYNSESITQECIKNSLPDLDQLILNKCYLMRKKNNKNFKLVKSSSSLINKDDLYLENDDDDDDDERCNSSDDDEFKVTVIKLPDNSIDEIKQPIKPIEQHQQQHIQQNLSTSPSLSISLTDTKSLNSTNIDEFNITAKLQNTFEPSSSTILLENTTITSPTKAEVVAISPDTTKTTRNASKSIVSSSSFISSSSSNCCISTPLSTSPLSHNEIVNNKSNSAALPLLNTNYLTAEIVSLCSLTSNYSQFDFLTEQQPTETTQQQQQQISVGAKKTEKKSSSNAFSSFLNRFTLLNKNKSLSSVNELSPLTTTTSLPLTSSNSATAGASSSGLFSGAFKLFHSTNPIDNANQKSSSTVVKSSSDYAMPSTVLILENRPSNLPAKSSEEALKHMKEYEKMVESAKKKG